MFGFGTERALNFLLQLTPIDRVQLPALTGTVPPFFGATAQEFLDRAFGFGHIRLSVRRENRRVLPRKNFPGDEFEPIQALAKP